jgi:PmbA protein
VVNATGAALLPLELAERALAYIDGDAQVAVTHERSSLSRFARSRPTHATEVETVHVQFTCVRDGHVGSATTTATDDDGLRTTAARAAAAAAVAAARGPAGAFPGLPEPGAAPRAHEGFDAATARLDPEAAGTALAAAFAAADARGLGAFGVWTAGAVRTAVASANGIRVQDAVTDAFMKVICRNADGRAGFASGVDSATAGLDAEAIAVHAAEKCVALGAAPVADLPPGEYPVVLEPEAVGLLLELAGALAFNGEAYAEGRSALSGRLGTRVAAPAINLSDSPRFARTLPRAFDAEGVAKNPMPLIQDGVAHGVCHDTRSAARAGGAARSTGHAAAPGGSPHGPAPGNLVLIGGGAEDEAELCTTIERGVYVTRLGYVNVAHEKETLLTGMTRDGTFLIEDGRVTRPLRDVRFTDSALRILSATEALTQSSRLVTAGELYGVRHAAGVVCPGLRAQGFRVTGAAVG